MSSDIEKKKTDTSTKVLLSIPIAVTVLGVLLFVIGCILEGPTSRGTVYSIVMILSLICFLFNPLPGFILSLIGTIKAARSKSVLFLVLGIVEIVFELLGSLILYLVIFVVGPGV